MRFAITLRSVFLSVAALMIAAAAARGQTAELYVARHVPVDATAQSAAKARDQAIVEGQRRALDIVLRRLTPVEAQPGLPRLDDAGVARLVDGFIVESEKASARRYIAELTVEFRPRAVQDLLRGAGVAFVAQSAPPTLVLPVLDEGGQVTLFDDPNPWRDAWRKAAERHSGLVPLVFPLGDLQDVAAVSPEEALAGDDAALSGLARRYGASRWAVAVARPDEDSVDVTLRRPTGVEVETVPIAPGRDREAALVEAAERSAARFEDEWKRETTAASASAVAGGPESQISASAMFSGLADWLALRDRLTRSPAVRQLEVVSISGRSAQLLLHYAGSPEQLAQALALQDVELVADQGFWRLALRGAAQAGR
jgi:hypothetical protein